jgi:hypothetical protein
MSLFGPRFFLSFGSYELTRTSLREGVLRIDSLLEELNYPEHFAISFSSSISVRKAPNQTNPANNTNIRNAAGIAWSALSPSLTNVVLDIGGSDSRYPITSPYGTFPLDVCKGINRVEHGVEWD